MLGQFVTDHPLLAVRSSLRAQCSHDIAMLDELGDGDLITIGGIIGALSRKYTKRGEPYAQFRLEGLAGGVEVIAFPSVYDAVPELIETDTIVLVTGRVDLRGRELQIRASEVKAPVLEVDGGVAGGATSSLVVELAASACTPGVLAKLKHLLEAAPGEVPVRILFVSSEGVRPLELGRFRVDPRGSLVDELRGLLGPTGARLERDAADLERDAARGEAPARPSAPARASSSLPRS
jgi:DNA polymerase-3 subunit alpha